MSNHSSVRFISVLFEKYGKRFAFMVSYCVDKTVLDLRSGFASFTSGTTGQVQVSFAFQRSQQQNPFKDRSGIYNQPVHACKPQIRFCYFKVIWTESVKQLVRITVLF